MDQKEVKTSHPKISFNEFTPSNYLTPDIYNQDNSIVKAEFGSYSNGTNEQNKPKELSRKDPRAFPSQTSIGLNKSAIQTTKSGPIGAILNLRSSIGQISFQRSNFAGDEDKSPVKDVQSPSFDQEQRRPRSSPINGRGLVSDSSSPNLMTDESSITVNVEGINRFSELPVSGLKFKEYSKAVNNILTEKIKRVQRKSGHQN